MIFRNIFNIVMLLEMIMRWYLQPSSYHLVGFIYGEKEVQKELILKDKRWEQTMEGRFLSHLSMKI